MYQELSVLNGEILSKKDPLSNIFDLKFLKLTMRYSSKKNLSYILDKYAQHVRESPHLWDSLMELDGKVLGCWCHPNPCHGHVLIQLINEVKINKRTDVK